MERSFLRRNRTVIVEEIDGVFGITGTGLDQVIKGDIMPRLVEGRVRTWKAPSALREDCDRFVDAGTRFIEIDDLVGDELFRLKQELRDRVAILPVCVSESGQLQLVTDQLTVRFDDHLNDSEVDAYLSEHKLRLVERFGFAPQLYSVAVGAARHPLEVSKTISEDDRISYAEPQFLAPYSSR